MSDPATDPRNLLAADRTIMAGERTYAAWMRTGLAAMFAGVGANAVAEDVWSATVGLVTGTLLMAFAAFCFIAAMWRQMRSGAPPPQSNIRPMPSWLLLIVNGTLFLVAVIGLFGLLFAQS